MKFAVALPSCICSLSSCVSDCMLQPNVFWMDEVPDTSEWGTGVVMEPYLCFEGRPVTALVYGELKGVSMWDPDGNPRSYVSVLLAPHLSRERACAARLVVSRSVPFCSGSRYLSR